MVLFCIVLFCFVLVIFFIFVRSFVSSSIPPNRCASSCFERVVFEAPAPKALPCGPYALIPRPRWSGRWTWLAAVHSTPHSSKTCCHDPSVFGRSGCWCCGLVAVSVRNSSASRMNRDNARSLNADSCRIPHRNPWSNWKVKNQKKSLILFHLLSNVPGIAPTGLTFFTSKAPHWPDFFGRGLRAFTAVGWWPEMLRWEAVVLSFYFKKQNSRPIKKLSFFLTHQLSWWHFHYWFFRRRHGRVGMGGVIIHARIYLDFEGFNFCCHRWAPNHRGNIWTWIFDWPGIHSSTATLVCWKKPPGLFQPTALCGGHRLWWWSGTCWNFECHRPGFCDGCHAYQA